MNQRGQASAVDALLFVLIAGSLAGVIFTYTAGYGQDESLELQNRFLRSYNSSVYKALLWSPIVRPGVSQADYLLAFSKEEFAVNGNLDNVRKEFAENFYTLNNALKSNYNYLFAISKASDRDDAELVVFKNSSAPGCEDHDCVFVCNGSTVTLTSFLNSPGNKFSTEGVITLPVTSTSSEAFATLTTTWLIERENIASNSAICGSTPVIKFECSFPAGSEKAECTIV